MARRMPQGRTATVSISTVNSALSDLQSLSELIAEAHQAGAGTVLPKRPAGSFTANEYALSLGLPRDTAFGQLRRLLRGGKYERVRAYHPTEGDNRLVVTFFYRKKGA